MRYRHDVSTSSYILVSKNRLVLVIVSFSESFLHYLVLVKGNTIIVFPLLVFVLFGFSCFRNSYTGMNLQYWHCLIVNSNTIRTNTIYYMLPVLLVQ